MMGIYASKPDMDNVTDSTLRFTKMSVTARAPVKASPLAAGFDLFAAENVSIEPGGRACVRTDIQLAVPAGCYARIAPRSGLALSRGIDVGAGVIDPDYRGNVFVLLYNFGSARFKARVGDRIAQLILERICFANLMEVDLLDDTIRGANGFGSSNSLSL